MMRRLACTAVTAAALSVVAVGCGDVATGTLMGGNAVNYSCTESGLRATKSLARRIPESFGDTGIGELTVVSDCDSSGFALMTWLAPMPLRPFQLALEQRLECSAPVETVDRFSDGLRATNVVYACTYRGYNLELQIDAGGTAEEPSSRTGPEVSITVLSVVEGARSSQSGA